MTSNPPGTTSASAIVEPTKKSHVLLYAIIGIVVIAIIIGVVLYVKSKKTTTGGSTNHGTSGTSGIGASGVSGASGTSGTTGPTACSAPSLNAIEPLISPYFTVTSITSTSTSFTVNFNTSAIPSTDFPMTLIGTTITFIAYVPGSNIELCAASIPFPGPMTVSGPLWSMTIPHNSTYPSDPTIVGNVVCPSLNLTSCGSTTWAAYLYGLQLVNKCGVATPAFNAAIAQNPGISGGVCMGASTINGTLTITSLG